jgi:hypothetical protein
LVHRTRLVIAEIVREACSAIKGMLWPCNPVRRVVTLGVELINDRDIVISSPESGFSVTYRKDGDAPMLVAIDGIGRVVDQAKVKFWAQAWKAAHEKARAVGWLSS